MPRSNTIYVFEYDALHVGTTYNNIVFTESHLSLLSKYITANPSPQLYTLLHRRVKFCNHVGVIKLGNLTIEILPKTDRHQEDHEIWQSVLLNMLAISLQVEARITTPADIQVRRHSVLETYIELFLREVRNIVHFGLVKKYRHNASNLAALKGKLLIHQHVSKNFAHAERFYVSHTIYDRDNIYNSILKEALQCVTRMHVSEGLDQAAKSLLINFPDFKRLPVNKKLFQRIQYDRKTERYRTAIHLAQIILMNFHPDIKGGNNNVLAIMFDMNLLWENYVYWILKKAAQKSEHKVMVSAQRRALFWKHPDNWNLSLKPDLQIEIKRGESRESVVLDTKWKYKKDATVEDVRQMYAYGHYFNSEKCFLVYPDNRPEDKIALREGSFYKPMLKNETSPQKCGLIFMDLLEGSSLNKNLGADLLDQVIKFKD